VDFFGRQQAAKQASSRLLWYFIFAVSIIFIGVNALLYLVAVVTTHETGQGTWLWHDWSQQALLGTLWLVAGGSLLEWFLLRKGGTAVAKMLNAQAIDFASQDAVQRQFINVCEEMAIASGVPVPSLYVLPQESTINAFVAGYRAQDSVLVVTQGALIHLTRDELQAVIGHEFSHILNGDMRLNTYMLSVLAGMLAVGQVGDFLMRSPTGDHPQNKSITPFWPLGLGMWLVGYIGLVLGRLIKAAISRERENLADAASVQFTRNPDALAGALYKIGQYDSYLSSWHAEQMSHMCFGESVSFSQWFATHPPLKLRIQTIAPTFLTRIKYQKPNKASTATPASASKPKSQSSSILAFSTEMIEAPQAVTPFPITPTSDNIEFSFDAPMTTMVGELQWADLQSAQYLYRTLSVEVSRALQSTAGAKAVLFALIAQEQGCSIQDLTQFFASQNSLMQWVSQLQQALACSDNRLALPIVELAIPRLLGLTTEERQQFMSELRRLAWLNQQLSVFEFSLLKLIEQALNKPKVIFREQTLQQLARPCAQWIMTLLQYGSHQPSQYARIYQQLLSPIFALSMPAMPSPQQATLLALDATLKTFNSLNLEGKKQLINLTATTIQSDGVLHRTEYELLRVLAALLNCPMPFVDGVIKK
jgi:Zn-dependent protease with chaperone function